MTIHEIADVLADVEFEDYIFAVARLRDDGPFYLYATYSEADTVTKVMARQQTRDWLLPADVTPSQVVSTAFLCAKTSVEHRLREWFLYKNRPIYMPHYDVEKLAEICEARHAE